MDERTEVGMGLMGGSGGCRRRHMHVVQMSGVPHDLKIHHSGHMNS